MCSFQYKHAPENWANTFKRDTLTNAVTIGILKRKTPPLHLISLEEENNIK